MQATNIFSQPNNAGVVAAPMNVATLPVNQGARLPFGYVVGFPSYTAATTTGTMGKENLQNLKTASDSNFEIIKQLKWDSGGGNGYIKMLSNQSTSVYGVADTANDYVDYANINTVFGNSEFCPSFQQPSTLPPSRVLSIVYRDVTAISGNLTLLFMGNKVYPSNSYFANSTYIRTTVPAGSAQKSYPMTLTMTTALGSQSGTFTIPQGQNFVWAGIAINDSANPVGINFQLTQMSNSYLFSSPVISRMISGTSNSNSPASNITLAGVRPFMLSTYINLVENSSVVVTITDIMNTSGYNTDITLYGYVTQQVS